MFLDDLHWAREDTLEVLITRLRTDDLAPGEEGEERLTQRIGDALSDRIRALPTHWPWMHSSFGRAPPPIVKRQSLTA